MDLDAIQQEVFSQTARINWAELERHFAAGTLIYVANELDLIEVGVHLIQDKKTEFEQWTTKKLVHPVTDTQAAKWHSDKTDLWASVVAPWVLVQERADKGAV